MELENKVIIFENGRVKYRLYREVWDQILTHYKPSKECLKRVSRICTKIVKKWDKDYIALSANQEESFRKEFLLTHYDFSHGLRHVIKDDLTLRCTKKDKLEENTFVNVKWHIARADIFRSNFIDLREKLDLEDSDGIIDMNSDTNINEIKDYLNLDSYDKYGKLKYDNFGKKSKYFYLRKKIEDLGCLVFETGSETHKIDSNEVLGVFIWYKTWPVILINSMEKNHQRRIFTLLHELYHFLNSRKNKDKSPNQLLITGKNIIGKQANEYKANQFAADILFSEKDWEDIKITKLDSLLSLLKQNLIKRGVSEITQMICLKNRNLISDELSKMWEKNYNDRIKRNLEKQQQDSLENKSAGWGTPRHIVSGKIFGMMYINLVFESHLQNKYNLTKISDFLRVRSLNVEDVFDYWL